MPVDQRRAVGSLGERLAEAHLVRSGYRVLERNHRTRLGELDLIASRRGCIVFCEVRARVAGAGGAPSEFGGPLESIGPAKRRRLRRMAREWLAGGGAERLRCLGAGVAAEAFRFDAVGVVLSREGRLISLEHVEDAF
jgi:putative endonuclease